MSQHPESRRCILLTKHRDPVDRQRLEIERGKTLMQQRDELLAPLGRGSSGEGHVETEVVHHIGVAPAIEMVDLGRRQRRRIAAGAIFCAERGAERIEIPDAVRGQLVRDQSERSAGTTAMKPLIALTTGVMTGIGRAVTAKASHAAISSASLRPGSSANGAFSVA